MGKYSGGTESSYPKYRGYVKVGPPFEVRKEFHQPDGEWAGGRWSAVIAGKVVSTLPYHVRSYKTQEKHVAPDKCLGTAVSFFLPHPKNNHVLLEDESVPFYDRYRYLATRWDQWGRPWPDFGLDFLLAKAGASTLNLTTDDDDRLLKEIIALLNTAEPFPVAIWDSHIGDLERQIPVETEVITQFYKLFYWDWFRKRPAWVPYKATSKKGVEYTVRDTTFLLRVVAPTEWAGTILRLAMNYTIKREENPETGEAWWDHFENANLPVLIERLGVPLADFVESVPDELLMEVERGQPANWLGPLELALQKERRFIHVKIPKKHIIRLDNLNVADESTRERIAGGKLVVSVPRTISDLTEEQIEAATQEAEEPIPGFEGEERLEFTKQEAMAEAEKLAGLTVWSDPDTLTTEGEKFAKTYLAPVYTVVGLNRLTPLVGWTKDKVRRMEILLNSDLFKEACKTEKEEVLVELGNNILAGTEEEEKQGAGGVF